MNEKNATAAARDTAITDAITPASPSDTKFMATKITIPKDRMANITLGLIGFEILSGTISGVFNLKNQIGHILINILILCV